MAKLEHIFLCENVIRVKTVLPEKYHTVKASAVCMVINRWRNNHRIVKINETTWRKV